MLTLDFCCFFSVFNVIVHDQGLHEILPLCLRFEKFHDIADTSQQIQPHINNLFLLCIIAIFL